MNFALMDPVQEIQKLTGGGLDYSLDCTGIRQLSSGCRFACDSRHVWADRCFGPWYRYESGYPEHAYGPLVVGIMGGDAISDMFIPQLIDLYLQGRSPFDKMIRFYPRTR